MSNFYASWTVPDGKPVRLTDFFAAAKDTDPAQPGDFIMAIPPGERAPRLFVIIGMVPMDQTIGLEVVPAEEIAEAKPIVLAEWAKPYCYVLGYWKARPSAAQTNFLLQLYRRRTPARRSKKSS